MPIDRIELVRAIGRYSHMGFLLGVLSVGGFFLGRWIDSKIWAYPVFAILLFLLGFGLGFYRFILMMLEDRKRDQGDKSKPRDASRTG